MYGLFETIEEYNSANQQAAAILNLGVVYAGTNPNQDKNGKYYMYLRSELIGRLECTIVSHVDLESVEYPEIEVENEID